MTAIGLKHVRMIESRRDALVTATRDALAWHAYDILGEIADFDAKREQDARAWFTRCTVKSALSPGCELDTDIALAKVLCRAAAEGVVFTSYDDAAPYAKSVKYGARSPGKNINAAILALNTGSYVDVLAIDLETMLALRESGQLTNMGHKTLRWALALYDARHRIVTLDVHMCRTIAKITGIGDFDNITDAAYVELERVMLDVIDECGYGHMPLVAQWALWNEERHAGKHAIHRHIAQD